MNRFFFFKAAFVFFLVVGSMFARWSGWRSNVAVEFGYNDNAAQLTDTEIELFENGDPKWLRLESTDDGFTRAGIDFEYRFRFGDIRAVTGCDYRFTKYLLDSERDYHFVRPFVDIRAGDFRCEAAIAAMPGYAAAIYGDVDLPDEPNVWAKYSMVRGELDARYEVFPKHSFGVAAKIERDKYNDYFPEYDGTSYRIGPTWRWSGPVYLKLHYVYRTYKARGYDTDGETLESSDETDISYIEDRFEGYISRDVEILGKDCLLGASWNLSHRFYTSEKPFSMDYIHIGRRDRRADIEPFFSVEIIDRIECTLSYKFTVRDADSPYFDLDPVKDYSRSIVGVKFDYSIR